MSQVVTKPVVLAADDDENAHFLLTRAFIKAGVSAAVVTLNDGSEVINYLTGNGKFADRQSFPLPQLLLLDIDMPRRSGFDVLEYISRQYRGKTFPVIILSSSENEADVKRSYALGCHSYVSKPNTFDELVRLVTMLENAFFSAPGSDGDRPGLSGHSGFRPGAAAPPQSTPSSNMKPKAYIPQDASNLFPLLIQQVKDYAIFLLNPEGNVLSWNEGAMRIKGYEAHEIIGKHFSTFYPEPDIKSDKPAFDLRMAQQMGRYEEEGWRVRKDGSRFWANVIITPLREPDARLAGYAQITRDLTQRKLQEESFQRLLDSEERFRLLVDQVQDYAIFILDAKGNIATWNQGAKRIKGYSSDEIIGKHFSIFYPPAAIAADQPMRELHIASQEGRYTEEGWRIRKDGSRFWASVVITSLWDKRGNLTGFAKVTRDLTQRKREEDALREKTEALESFAHTLSHDLRAPLRTISSFSEILANEARNLPSSEQDAYLGRIRNAARTMSTLIDDVLKLSQISLVPITEERVALEELMEEILATLAARIQQTGARVEIQRPLPVITANRTLLLQIFGNLIGNALKFFPEKTTPRIAIFARRLNGDCEIHVKDSGIGVPEHLQEKIFDVFNRGDAGRAAEGTGVGLTIVKKAVERLGGHIALKSTEGEGSDFVVTLSCPTPIPHEHALH